MSSSSLLRAAAAGVAVLATAVAGNANATTTTGSLGVSASVIKVCLISNGTLAFGSYDPTSGTANKTSTTVTLTCTPGSSYDIGMSAGGGSGASTTTRLMTINAGTATLGYQLFQDSGYLTNWGNTVGTDTLHSTSSTSALANTITVYGEIPANEVAGVGSYADSVAMTVTY